MRAHALALLAALTLAASDAAARPIAANPEDYRQRLRELQPGDVLRLAPGDYRAGLPLHRLAGTAAAPIVIEGPQVGAPAVFHAAPGRNTVSLADAAHLIVRRLRLEGHGLPVDGVKAEGHAGHAHHITLEELVIAGHGHNQQTVGISTKCPAWNWTVRGNTIVGAGTGMYFGNSDGTAPFVAGVIEDNRVLEPLGYALQIKHQRPRPTLAGMPAQRSITVIRRNLFVKQSAGDPQAPRPSVLVGHLPLDGAGADDRYAIYANLFLGNRLEALFQGEGRIALYANLFVNPHGDAIHIQPHNDLPRHVVVARNTIVAAGIGLRLLDKEGMPAYPRQVSGNAIFAATPLVGAADRGNFAAPAQAAADWLRAPDAPPARLDLRPKTPWPSAAAMRTASDDPLAGLPDGELDAAGQPWQTGALGAFAHADAPPARHPPLPRQP